MQPFDQRSIGQLRPRNQSSYKHWALSGGERRIHHKSSLNFFKCGQDAYTKHIGPNRISEESLAKPELSGTPGGI